MEAAAGQRQGLHQRIGRRDQPALRADPGEQLHLFAGGHRAAAEARQMSEADVDQHTEVGGQDRFKALHLARGGNPGLKDPQLGAWRRGEHGQWHSHLAVPAAGAGGHAIATGQQGCQGALDHGLAIAAGDRHHPLDVAAAVPGRQLLQRCQRVVHKKVGTAGRGWWSSPLPGPAATHHDHRGPGGFGGLHIGMAVAAAAAQGKEQISRQYPARIDCHRSGRCHDGMALQITLQQVGEGSWRGQGHRWW